MLKNPFAEKTDKQVQDDLMKQAGVLKELEELKSLGRDMLADQRYTKFREVFENLLSNVLIKLIRFNHVDNNVYATNMRVTVQQINDLLAFLDTPVNFLNHVAQKRLTE